MKLPLAVATLAILGFQGHARAFSAAQLSDLVGDWSGTSLCQVRPSPCHDEQVVYHISKPHEHKVTIQADKIVEGKLVTMGVSEWTYDNSSGTLAWEMPRGTWKLVVDADTMDGTLIVPENVLFRKVHLKRSK